MVVDGNPGDLQQDPGVSDSDIRGAFLWEIGSFLGSVGGTMADDDVLFEDVYELCEVIGK